jgi:peptidoglycan hydrolase CwlO-like protein
MSYTNYPSAENPQQPQRPRDNRTLIYAILIILLLGTWGYIIYDKSQTSQKIATLETSYSNVDSARNLIQADYNSALARMDSLTGSNTQLKGQLAERQKNIDNLKGQIRSELAKKNADLAKTRRLVDELKAQVTDLFAQIDQLKQQNQQLTTSNQQLTTLPKGIRLLHRNRLLNKLLLQQQQKNNTLKILAARCMHLILI